VKTVIVTWEVTERHMAVVEVDDDWDPETGEINTNDLAEYEDGSSYEFTSNREIIEIEEA